MGTTILRPLSGTRINMGSFVPEERIPRSLLRQAKLCSLLEMAEAMPSSALAGPYPDSGSRDSTSWVAAKQFTLNNQKKETTLFTTDPFWGSPFKLFLNSNPERSEHLQGGSPTFSIPARWVP